MLKIAISTDGKSISAHFGRCSSFTVLEIEGIISKIFNGTLEGGESLCKPSSGRGYGVERTDAVIEGKEYVGGREHHNEDIE